MRIYILVSGVLRTFYTSLFPFLKEFIEINTDNTIKILISTTDKFIDENYMIHDYNNHLKNLKENSNINLLLLDDIKLDTKYNYFSSREKNIIYQWYRLNTLLNYLETYDIHDDDIIIRLRPDIHFNIKPEILLMKLKKIANNDGIFIPYGDENALSINDQIAIGKYKFMKLYCNIYAYLKNMELNKPFFSQGVLYEYLTINKIKINRIDLSYTLCLSESKLVALSGDSGVGKTTLMTSLKKIFPFDKNIILEADRYHKWERHDNNWKSITHLNPDANYLEKMLDDTFMLKMGEQVEQVDYDHINGKFTDAQIIEPKQYILICGLHTLYNEEMRKISDLKIFIDAEYSLKKLWKIRRDMTKRGYTFEKCLEIFEKRQIDYEKYIFPQKKYADIVVYYYSNNKIPEIFDNSYEYFDLQMDLQISDYYLDFVEDYLLYFSKRVDQNTFKIKNNITREEIIHKLPEKFKCFIKNEDIDNSYLGIIQALIILIFINPT
jgi:uridine kinase